MAIKSYLIYPHEGKKDKLIKKLSMISQCEVTPARNKDVLVVTTETNTEVEETGLKQKLETTEGLKFLVLVSGFDTFNDN